MKLTKSLSLLLSLFLLVGTTACSDDDGPAVDTEKEAAVGTYRLVELNISPATDVNGDGNTTSNVLTELPCATGTLDLRSDNSFTWTFIPVSVTFITGDLYNFACSSTALTTSGVWEVNNGLLTISDGANLVAFTVGSDGRLTSTAGDNLPEFRNSVYEKQ